MKQLTIWKTIYAESKMYNYLAYRDNIGSNLYKSVKPYREYILETENTDITKKGNYLSLSNVLVYTKEKFSNRKISNKMIFIPTRNISIFGDDGWVVESGKVSL